MSLPLAMKLVGEFEQGRLSRREVAARLMGLGAAMAAGGAAAAAIEDGASPPVFEGKGLDHIALNVTDVARSREFYAKHLGLVVKEDGGDQRCFMGPPESDFILALFRSGTPGMNHYCYAIDDYDPDEVMQKLGAAGARPRREGDRIYFPDPDGITVQLAQRSENR